MSAASAKKKFRVTDRGADAPPAGYFDRQERLPDWDQERIGQARCLVVGAGAIGNELIKNLALLGFSKLTICDFDTIENTNLSRTALFSPADVGHRKAEVAARRFEQIALGDRPVAKAFTGDIVHELGRHLYARFDLVFGCLDNVEARIAVNKACRMMGVPWIDAGIRGLSGHVAIYGTGETPCLECGLSRNQWLNAQERYSCDNVKKAAFKSQVVATVQVTSALVAALQAQEALKLLFGDTGTLGRKMIFDGRRCDFDLIRLTRDPACMAHVDVDDVRELELSTDLSLAEFLGEAAACLGFANDPILDLSGDRSFVQTADCRGCGTTVRLMKPNFRITERELFCSACRADPGRAAAGLAEGQPTRLDALAELSRGRTPEEVLGMSLDAVGIPPGHLLHLRDGEADEEGVHVSPVAGLEPFVP